ncbi:MAG: sigma-70 family RNA polymerase sigma factor [Aeromonadales bacterium]|jgi:RNA polymerase sigma-70 factor (ECF subfamily)|nr:sigma-70 family RNA polymerase sigma factor [Aeromonadales bacterium]MDY2890107.1 sigma-70 family RNA polymerase sigma factor [Succinivibrio sp.]
MSPKAPDAGSSSDEELVRQVQAGNISAYNLLVVRYQHRVVKIAQKYVSDFADASDIAQEAFIKAYKALPNFRGESSFYTWLYRIVTNAAKNFLDSSSRQRSQVDVDDEVLNASSPEALTDRQTPDSIIESEELKKVILKAVGELPKELREAFMLRELEGLSYDEISEKAGVPIGTVRSRIFRARQYIESKMEQFRKG